MHRIRSAANTGPYITEDAVDQDERAPRERALSPRDHKTMWNNVKKICSASKHCWITRQVHKHKITVDGQKIDEVMRSMGMSTMVWGWRWYVVTWLTPVSTSCIKTVMRWRCSEYNGVRWVEMSDDLANTSQYSVLFQEEEQWWFSDGKRWRYEMQDDGIELSWMCNMMELKNDDDWIWCYWQFQVSGVSG